MKKAPERSRKEILSKNICYLIKLNKKNEKQVAEEAGITKSALSSWICMIHVPRDENLKLLADYFEVSITDLYTDYSEEARRRSMHTIAQNSVIRAMDDDPLYNAFVLEGLELLKHEKKRLEEYLEQMKNRSDEKTS